mgnify:FL=1
MEQACWHSGVDAAMGFCVVDWGKKDLGKAGNQIFAYKNIIN